MLTPRDEADLAELVRGTSEPLVIQGGGTRPVGQPIDGTRLSVAGISGVSLYEPGALTLVARAGTPLAEIESALAAEGQMLAFEPMDHRTLLGTEGEPTIGGVVAGNVSGPRRVQAGACRDFLLGVRFVDGRGDILSNGGRVMKNVTGYDLSRLLCGSRGTLGALSEVSLKVLPRPEAAGCLLLHDLTIADAVKAMSAALTSPFEVSGAAHAPQGVDGTPVTMLRFEGFEASVGYRAGKLRDLLAAFGEAEIETRQEGPESVRSGWEWIRNVRLFQGKTAVWRVSIKASDGPELLDTIAQTMACDALFDLGGGLIWIGADDQQLADCAGWSGGGSTDPLSGAGELHGTLQEYMRLIGGHATLVKAPTAVRADVSVFQPEPEPLARLAEGIRQQFDPRGILNRGIMG